MPIDRNKINELVAGVAAGDRKSFRDLFNAIAPSLKGIAFGILHDAEAAEDAVQDAFLRIWRRAKTYDRSRGHAAPWMFAIARNCALTERLRRSRQGAVVDYDDLSRLALAVAETAPDPADLEALRQCLDALEEPYRTCILSAHGEGCTREDLAQRFEKPVNTIKTWLRRGLIRLKACLGGVHPAGKYSS